MATKRWTGSASPRPQIDTITLAGTWLATETITLTIADQSAVITIGTLTTVTQVATTVVEAINTGSFTDTSASMNVGGALKSKLGAFAELTATSSAGVVTLTGNASGKPFDITVAETSTGGTATLLSDGTGDSQLASGPNWYSEGDNWSDGSVPADNDDIVFDAGSVDCLYGLETSSIEPLSVTIYQGYTGKIGLEEINTDNSSLPYMEDQPTYLKFTEAGGVPATTTISIGEGTGSGSSRIKLDLNDVTQAAVTIYNTGTASTGHAVYLKGPSTTTSTIDILDGSVGLAYYESETADFRGGITTGGNPSSLNLTIGNGCTCTTIDIAGGTVNCFSSNPTGTEVITQTGGTLYLDQGTWSTIDLWGGTQRWGDVTATAFNIGSATLDCATDLRAKVVTTGTAYRGATINDPHAKITITAFYVTGCSIADITLDLGTSQQLITS